MQLIQFTNRGMYCEQGDFYIDPWLPVKNAVITHAHSDHARAGMENYLCHRLTAPVLQLRIPGSKVQTVEWGESLSMNGVKVSFHPAGHVIGSSQIRVEYGGEVWVASGDYKTYNDGISGEFEPVPCHVFITESTFGLPIYKWQPQYNLYSDIRKWVTKNEENNRSSLIIAYSLGKAQRVLDALKPLGKTILVHGAVWNVQEALAPAGIDFGLIERVTPDTPREKLKGAIIVAPPGAESSSWRKKFEPLALGICSGWMQVRGNVRRRNADAGFVLSDHADWPGLISAIEQTGAEKVFVTHGFQAVFSKYLNETGIESQEVTTLFGVEEETEQTESE